MIKIPRDALLLCLLIAPLAQAASASGPPANEAPFDEVVVEGARSRLSELRAEIFHLEDRFYDRYNELNKNDDYDVHCRDQTSAGTRMKRRVCRAVFEDRAIETESREYLVMLQFGVNTGFEGSPPVPAIMEIEGRRPEYQKTMLKVTSEHRELRKMLEERAELMTRFEKTRRKLFGLKPKAEEKKEAAHAAPAPH